MKHTFFDKIIIIIIALMIAVFLALAGYTTYQTQKVLVQEKQSNLVNMAVLLSQQTIIPYLQGNISLETLQTDFDEFEDALKTNVWYFSAEGYLITVSNEDAYDALPDQIHNLVIDMTQGFSQVGDFNELFKGNMISVGMPIYIGKQQEGYLILHTSIQELDALQNDMLSIMYMPFLVMILVVGIVLAYLSQMIIRPLAKMNHAAREYAKGNFEVKTGVKRDDEIGELSDSLEYMADELSKLDEYRSNFIANISHDFRSPLTSIKGYLEAMLDGTIPVEKYDRYLNIVLNESKRLTKLTSGLLELNNFDTYGPVLKYQEFDIMDVIYTTRNTVEGICEERKISLMINCLAENTMVYADKMKIGQVVNNLVDNAIKFSPQDSKIMVTIYESNEKLFISVKDAGVGIEKDKQNKVWDRFYKTDISRGKDKSGTGLGLAITKEIIKAHGENINLTSTEGVGSEFVFSMSHKNSRENGQIG